MKNSTRISLVLAAIRVALAFAAALIFSLAPRSYETFAEIMRTTGIVFILAGLCVVFTASVVRRHGDDVYKREFTVSVDRKPPGIMILAIVHMVFAIGFGFVGLVGIGGNSLTASNAVFPLVCTCFATCFAVSSIGVGRGAQWGRFVALTLWSLLAVGSLTGFAFAAMAFGNLWSNPGYMSDVFMFYAAVSVTIALLLFALAARSVAYLHRPAVRRFFAHVRILQ